MLETKLSEKVINQSFLRDNHGSSTGNIMNIGLTPSKFGWTKNKGMNYYKIALINFLHKI